MTPMRVRAEPNGVYHVGPLVLQPTITNIPGEHISA